MKEKKEYRVQLNEYVDYGDGDFESMKFQNHVINILEGGEE